MPHWISSLTDSALSGWNFALQLTAVGGAIIAALAGLCQFSVRAEIGHRQAKAIQKQNERLKEKDDQIAALQPKPLKDRVIIFLKKYGLFETAKTTGQRRFGGAMTFGQLAELQGLAEEDSGHVYLRLVETTNMIMNRAATQQSLDFEVTDEVFK